MNKNALFDKGDTVLYTHPRGVIKSVKSFVLVRSFEKRGVFKYKLRYNFIDIDFPEINCVCHFVMARDVKSTRMILTEKKRNFKQYGGY